MSSTWPKFSVSPTSAPEKSKSAPDSGYLFVVPAIGPVVLWKKSSSPVRRLRSTSRTLAVFGRCSRVCR